MEPPTNMATNSSHEVATTTPRHLGKAPMKEQEEPITKERKNESTDEPMTDGDTAIASSRLSELYVSDDMTAYKIDKHLTVQQKLLAQNPDNKDLRKALQAELKQHQQESLTRIFISNSKNTHFFANDRVAQAVISEIHALTGFELPKQQLSVTPLGRAGPYVVAMQNEYALILMDEGTIELIDTTADPCVTQIFSVKNFEDNDPKPEDQQNVKMNDETNDDKMTFSIFFNLPVEYTGLFDEKGELETPKKNISEALQQVFVNPNISFKLIQPRTELGILRNALRAIIVMPKIKQMPADMDRLSALKIVSLSTGKRPATASISQDIRKIFGISNCCFRTKCTEDQGCSFREQRWEEIGYRQKRELNPFQAKKRAREAEQNAKMEQEQKKIRELRAARRPPKAMCRWYLEGKCDKKRYECQKGEHGSNTLAKLIQCASSKPNADWICRLGDQCPYGLHINPE